MVSPTQKSTRYDSAAGGDVTDTHVEWIYSKNGPSTPSPLLIDQQLMFISDDGIFTTLDASTGKVIHRKRIGGRFCASPIAVGNHVYLFDRDGKATIIKTFSRKEPPKIIAQNQLEQGLMASPVVTADALYLRTPGFLYRIEE